MTDFNQAPAVANTPPVLDEYEGPGLMTRLGNTRAGQFLSNVAMSAAIIVPGGAVALENPTPVNAAGNTPELTGEQFLTGQSEAELSTAFATESSVQHRHSKLGLQTILNKIHGIIPSGDFSQGHTKKDRILPTSAFLTGSSGGFRTNCKNPYVSTYRYYKLSPLGQAYKTCGPLGVWPQTSTEGQFQGKLNHLGKVIENSANLHFPSQTTTRVGGNRHRVKATYECPTPDPSQDPSATTATNGVKKIIIHRNHTAAVTTC